MSLVRLHVPRIGLRPFLIGRPVAFRSNDPTFTATPSLGALYEFFDDLHDLPTQGSFVAWDEPAGPLGTWMNSLDRRTP